MMVKALCCHTFARQNLFSPAARPTAITAAGRWSVVASEDKWVRVYDLEQEPGSLTAAFPSVGRVKALTVCREENFIAALEVDPRPSPDVSRSNRCVRVYRNFWGEWAEVARPRNANQPPASPLSGQRLDVLQFSSLHAPTGLTVAVDGRLMAAVGHSVWVAAYSRQRQHFDLLFTLTFSFPVCRLAMLGKVLAVGSMDEVHVIRVCDQPPRSRFDDEVILPSMAKERRDVKSTGRAMEVLGPTVDFDSAAVHFSSTAQPKQASFIETLLYRRFPASSNTRVHTLQLVPTAQPAVFVATTFEGLLYRVEADAVTRSAEYAFSERTLQARVGTDHLLHVITACGLNTYTTRCGDAPGCYPVPDHFPICMVGSLVWREINMRCLLAWSAGLLLYTEKDNLYTLYSLQFQPVDHLFTDMLQSARQFASDSVMTSCHLACEAFHLHSVRDTKMDREKAVSLVELHMNALPNLHTEHLRQLFVVGDFSFDDVIYMCEKLKEKDVDPRCFLRLYASTAPEFAASVQRASEETMRRFYPLLMEADHEEYIRCILLRNDRNWFTSREDLLACVSLDSPEALLLACLFLFETSRVDEIEAFVHRGNHAAMCDALVRFSHLLGAGRLLTDFGMFLCLIAPRLLNDALLRLPGEPAENLPQCCLHLLLEARFLQRPSLLLLSPVVEALLSLLAAGQPPLLNAVRPANPAVCPHKSLRCRRVDSWLLRLRMPELDSLPPFRGVSAADLGAHRPGLASACSCAVCHAHLLRLQGLVCWALEQEEAAAVLAAVERSCETTSEYARTSLRFLVAHRRSVGAAFAVLSEQVELGAAVAYLRRHAARVGGPAEWAAMIGGCEADSERQWAVLRTGMAMNAPHAAAEMVAGVELDGREAEVQALLSRRYTSAICHQLFESHVEELATH